VEAWRASEAAAAGVLEVEILTGLGHEPVTAPDAPSEAYERVLLSWLERILPH
jgi:hypothetical protein